MDIHLLPQLGFEFVDELVAPGLNLVLPLEKVAPLLVAGGRFLATSLATQPATQFEWDVVRRQDLEKPPKPENSLFHAGFRVAGELR